jgi:hypothetical protein
MPTRLPACLLQLALHRCAPKGSLSLAQQQLLAEATVAVAFTRRQPLLLLQAAGTFKQLEAAAGQVCVGGWGGGGRKRTHTTAQGFALVNMCRHVCQHTSESV